MISANKFIKFFVLLIQSEVRLALLLIFLLLANDTLAQ
jgi:hypothetical protein